MGRRQEDENVGFGSDSFLDVITNMVGILIILIVIAGMKVSKAPVLPRDLSAAAADQRAETNAPQSTPAEPPPVPLSASPPANRSAAPPKPQAAKVIEPSPELKRRARKLDSELAKLDAQQRQVRERLQQESERERDLRTRRAQAVRLLAAESNRLGKVRTDLGRIRGTLDQTQTTLADLKQAVDQAENSKSPVKEIRHRLNPVSRVVEGQELHFRLAKGRVAPVPIDDLIERLRPQIEERKRRLIDSGSHRGQVGPVDGFLMRYVVTAQPLSAIEELRQGGGMVRFELSQWEVVAEPDLADESADEALRAGSKFLQAVQRASPGTTLTFWVYPDSFEPYRRLKQFAHDEYYTVAARPLPFGTPIAGSPRGSRSAGQ